MVTPDPKCARPGCGHLRSEHFTGRWSGVARCKDACDCPGYVAPEEEEGKRDEH